jgi:hypothetical protein
LSLGDLRRMYDRWCYCGRNFHVVGNGEVWNIDCEGKWKPLVTRELFDRCQQILHGRNRQAKSGIQHEVAGSDYYPLRRILICPTCGVAVTASASTSRHNKRVPYYHCKAGHVRVGKEKAEAQFIEMLRRLRPDGATARQFQAAMSEAAQGRVKTAQKELDALQRRVELLDKDRNELEQAFLFKKAIEDDVYYRQSARLKQERDDAVSEITALEVSMRNASNGGVSFGEALSFLSTLDSKWNRSSSQQRRAIAAILFPEGVILEKDRVGTPSTSCIFSILQPNNGNGKQMAARRGVEPL